MCISLVNFADLFCVPDNLLSHKMIEGSYMQADYKQMFVNRISREMASFYMLFAMALPLPSSMLFRKGSYARQLS